MSTSSWPLAPEGAAHRWTRLAVTVDAGRAELAADLWFRFGAAAVEELEAGDSMTLVAGFSDPDAASAATRAAVLAGYGPVEEVPIDAAALDRWRTWAEPVAAGGWWLTPSWVAAPAGADPERVLWIDPGHTFGSGSHPTTRLLVELIDDRLHPGDRVLDVGAGSGVLGIFAARRGASEVLAIDIDPASPDTVRANAEANQVGHLVQVDPRPAAVMAESGEQFDVVVANLLAPVIADLAPALVACVRSGGALGVSGLLADRWEPTAATLSPLVVTRVTTDDGWAALLLEHHDRTER